MRRRIAPFGAALLLLGIAACGDASDESSAPDEQPGAEELPDFGEGTQEQPELPEPDLKGIPETVAEVNGEPITREEFAEAYEAQFQQAAMEAQMSGAAPDEDQLKEQVLNGMIGNALVFQEVEGRGYEVTAEELEESLAAMAEASGLGSGEEFLAAMAEQGMDEDEVMSELETQVEVERFLDEEVGEVTASEEELQQLYDQMVAQQEQMPQQEGQPEQEVPSFEEARPMLEEQIEGQKENEAVQDVVAGLRENADVTVNL